MSDAQQIEMTPGDSATEHATSPTQPRTPYLPGDGAMWFFVLGDMIIFASYFVAFTIFREQVRASHTQPHRAAELPLRHPHVIVLKRHPGMHHPGSQAIQFLELGEHVLLNGIRQRYVVRGEDQLHTDNMQSRPSIFNRQFPT